MSSEALGVLQAFNDFAGDPVTYTATAILGKSLERRPLESFSTGAVARVANSARARAIASNVPGKVATYDTLSAVTKLARDAKINPRTPLPQAVQLLVSKAAAAPSVVKPAPAPVHPSSPPVVKVGPASVHPATPKPTVKPAVIVPKGPTLVSISDAENRAIDDAIKAGAAVHVPALTGRQLFDAASEVVLKGEAPTLGVPAIHPVVAVASGPAAGASKPSVGVNRPVGGDVNLSNILSGVNKLAQTGLGLATTYAQINALVKGKPIAPAAGPPAAVTPASTTNRPVMTATGLTPQPALFTTPQAATLASQGLVRPAMAAIPATLETGAVSLLRATGIRSMAGVGKAAAIAAATGLGIDVVSGILEAGRPRRRRRRMLTKSDVADISTMSALLGKNSEAFKTWLAGALRR